MIDKKDIPKKPEAAGLSEIKSFLIREGIRFQEEYKFSKTRMFRFDIYLTDLNIGVEYEGLQSEKSGHTTSKGYTDDCDKYNLAVIERIYVLRYTAFNYNQFEKDIARILNEH